MPKIKDRTGETNCNFYGTKMTIVNYINKNDITVEFEDGYIVKSRYSEFKNGTIKNPYDKRVFGVGYHGIGEYKVSINQKHTIQYNYWYDMLKRCYDERYKQKHPTYKNKTVCEEWHNFQVFAKWFDENYYTINNDERMELDKDILIRDNMEYNPNTCIFVPKIINTILLKKDANRGECPIGITKRGNKFYARCSKCRNDKYYREFIGSFNDPLTAFEAYKSTKENYIKEVADEFKNQIPKKLYKALYDYEVRITD